MARELVTVSLEERSYIPNDWKDEKGKPEAKALTIKFKPLSKRQLAHYSDNSSRLNIGSNTISLGWIEVFMILFLFFDMAIPAKKKQRINSSRLG